MKKKVDIPDQQLVTSAKRGDRNAFDLLVIKYQFRVRSIVAKLLRDSDDVDDVMQETFVSAFRALGHFRGDSQFFTWLYRIAINTAKNYIVSRGRRPPASDVEFHDAEGGELVLALSGIETPESSLEVENLKKVIDGAIEALPADLKTAFTLREFAGLSYEDITEVMNCPVGTVRSRIFRARESIDKAIKELI